jgi:hypothetical protein
VWERDIKKDLQVIGSGDVNVIEVTQYLGAGFCEQGSEL